MVGVCNFVVVEFGVGVFGSGVRNVLQKDEVTFSFSNGCVFEYVE